RDGKVRVAEARSERLIAQRRALVLGGYARAQRLVLEAIWRAFPEVGEILERDVVRERDQAMRPWHVPAVVEARRRHADHAGYGIRLFRSEHQRQDGAERQPTDDQRQTFIGAGLSRTGKVPAHAGTDLVHACPREHRDGLAVVHELRTVDVETS